ncbi:unnamed protein product [Nesidiocoris tenuis]|uniref:Uncharacterized protein n=1 Tax=Nesidiocoris tenuis TaxID=355587 RepID=A0A6H5H0A5_9HEMI|nr:unnamed protein product [Nesidiocoris tenuis]
MSEELCKFCTGVHFSIAKTNFTIYRYSLNSEFSTGNIIPKEKHHYSIPVSSLSMGSTSERFTQVIRWKNPKRPRDFGLRREEKQARGWSDVRNPCGRRFHCQDPSSGSPQTSS